MVVNKSPVPIVVFSFPFVDPVYVAFSDKAEIKPGQNAVLEAASMGAGKITIGVATRIVRQAGGKPIDYAMAVASADLCQVAMLGQPRYELGLKNAVDNTVAEVVMGGDNKLLLKGPSVSRCSVGDSTEIEGASDTGMAFMRFAQLCAKTGLAVATGGGSAAAQKGAVEALKVGAKKLAKKLASKGASEVAKTADLQGKAKRQAKKNLGMVPVKPQPRGGGGGGGGFSGGAMQCSTSGKVCAQCQCPMLKYAGLEQMPHCCLFCFVFLHEIVLFRPTDHHARRIRCIPCVVCCVLHVQKVQRRQNLQFRVNEHGSPCDYRIVRDFVHANDHFHELVLFVLLLLLLLVVVVVVMRNCGEKGSCGPFSCIN